METPKRVIQVDRNPHTIGLKSIFKVINDDRSPDKREARRFLEQTKTSIQCSDVIKTAPVDCWLCGIDFVKGDKIQCDHILPFPQGPIFLDIYERKYGREITESIRLEYAYAHAYCNNYKNSKVFLTGDERGYYPDIDGIVDCLTEIKSRRYPAMNLETQVDSVIGRMFDISDFINKTLEITPEKYHSFNIRGKNLTLEFTKPSMVRAALNEASVDSDMSGGRRRTRKRKTSRKTRRNRRK